MYVFIRTWCKTKWRRLFLGNKVPFALCFLERNIIWNGTYKHSKWRSMQTKIIFKLYFNSLMDGLKHAW